MSGLLARIWRRLRGPVQWYVLWVFHAKFMIGVTGLVRDPDGRVLLLRHRLWPSGRQWGLPTGYARTRERFEDTVVREVKEETGLDVTVGQLVNMTSGYKLRLEVAYAAELVGGHPPFRTAAGPLLCWRLVYAGLHIAGRGRRGSFILQSPSGFSSA